MSENAVRNGRYTAELDDEGIVVLLIGMRFNRWWRMDKWWFVVAGMYRMVQYLRQADDGLLNTHVWVGRTPLLVQYWRSLDELNAFAADPHAPHARTWRDFNRRVAGDGTVGIFHETYRIVPGQSEAMYVNMPRFGLGGAARSVAVDATRHTARQRMDRQRRSVRTDISNP
ncbi:DUF4188 domain-containing protein [Pseudonocardia eucalypti]|uniref:DUF4188 domain-containing protein n=1 Tax=Pseudonocardia eucalypti TaxID=648755 RepID=A0ABP9Q489_9PSEU|nr:hypothetical protein [Pseudonocardia eucalypti]